MTDADNKKWMTWLNALQAIAQNGLEYSKNVYDIERFQMLRQIISEMTSNVTLLPRRKIEALFAAETGYMTPKLDVRAAIFEDNRVLLVKEVADGLWTMPGGWAEVNCSPRESVEKEVLEETGFQAQATKLIALFDKRYHDHPLEYPHAYKAFFLCKITGGTKQISHETSAVEFFPLDKLPPLSTPRATAEQIHTCYRHYQQTDLPTEVD